MSSCCDELRAAASSWVVLVPIWGASAGGERGRVRAAAAAVLIGAPWSQRGLEAAPGSPLAALAPRCLLHSKAPASFQATAHALQPAISALLELVSRIQACCDLSVPPSSRDSTKAATARIAGILAVG